VFREVAGASAAYFDGADGAALAAAVRGWLAQHATGAHPAPGGIRWKTWQDNARELLSIVAAEGAP
jgi:hypothetical protein